MADRRGSVEPKGDRREAATAGIRGCALHSALPVFPAGGLPGEPGRGAEGSAGVLEHPASMSLADYPASTPTTAPLMQVASVPDRIERMPSATTSCLRSGTIAP